MCLYDVLLKVTYWDPSPNLRPVHIYLVATLKKSFSPKKEAFPLFSTLYLILSSPIPNLSTRLLGQRMKVLDSAAVLRPDLAHCQSYLTLRN